MSNVMRLLAAAVESSAVVRVGQRVGRNSLLVKAATASARWARQTRVRIVDGIRGGASPDAFDAPAVATAASGSRCVAALETCFAVPIQAWRRARAQTVLTPLVEANLAVRVRLIGWALVIAVLIHTMLLGALGSPIHTPGWSVRLGLVALGILLWWRPDEVASAWRSRVGHRH